MVEVTSLDWAGEHEELLLGRDRNTGYLGVVAIHSTVSGPAVGGTRFCEYSTLDAAISDALRLARGMTYKTAMAGLPLGGGKAVVVASAGMQDRAAIFRAHGRFVESLGGRFLTAEDVGTSLDDMEWIREETRYVGGTHDDLGDPGPYTARGVLRAMQAAALYRWGSASLRGRRVAIQGCGSVGTHLVRALASCGADLVVADAKSPRALAAAELSPGVSIASPDEILGVSADIFAPCALGGTLDSRTLHRLRAPIVAGAANNQLLTPSAAEDLDRNGVTYVPDFLANAGGVISGCHTLLGWSVDAITQRIEAIFDATYDLLVKAGRAEESPERVAQRMVESALARAWSARH